jgi:hypothetical protein
MAGNPMYRGECQLIPNGITQPIRVQTFSMPFFQTHRLQKTQPMPFVIPGPGDAEFRTVNAFASYEWVTLPNGVEDCTLGIYMIYKDRYQHLPNNPFTEYMLSQTLDGASVGSTTQFNRQLEDFFSVQGNHEIQASDYRLICHGQVNEE